MFRKKFRIQSCICIFMFFVAGIYCSVTAANRKYLVKVLVVGKENVGKTFLIDRIVAGDISGFDSNPQTIRNQAPPATYIKHSFNSSEIIKTPVYNYGPFELLFEFREANVNDPNIEKYYESSNIIIPIFDINDLNFNAHELENWNNKIRNANPKTYEIFFANKTDLYPNYKDINDKRLHNLMMLVAKFPHGGFVAGSLENGDRLNGLLSQLIDWGREWGTEVTFFRTEQKNCIGACECY